MPSSPHIGHGSGNVGIHLFPRHRQFASLLASTLQQGRETLLPLVLFDLANTARRQPVLNGLPYQFRYRSPALR
jgi:hypothetical protein